MTERNLDASRPRLIDELGMVFAHAAVDAWLRELAVERKTDAAEPSETERAA